MKTIVIFHKVDLDGWMSAAIVKHWFIKNYKASSFHRHTEKHELLEDDELPTGSDLYFLGWDYGDPIPNLSKYKRIIMCDISFPIDEMFKISDNLIYIDHHISSITEFNKRLTGVYGLRDTNFAACELTWKYFFPNKEMPEIVRLLGMYDSFRHKGTDEEQKVLEFQYGARACMSNHEECYDKLIDSIGGLEKVQGAIFDTVEAIQLSGGDIYDYLCIEARKIYNKAFEIEISGYKFLCSNTSDFNPSSFNLPFTQDGYDGYTTFAYSNNKKSWVFSLRSETINVSKIAQQFGGGGHKGVAGFVCDSETMLKIING